MRPKKDDSDDSAFAGLPAKSLDELLAGIVGKKGLGRTHKTLELLREGWRDVAGPELLAHTRVMSLRTGRLTIEVDSASRCHRLASFERERLLSALQERLPRLALTELRFKVGAFG